MRASKQWINWLREGRHKGDRCSQVATMLKSQSACFSSGSRFLHRDILLPNRVSDLCYKNKQESLLQCLTLQSLAVYRWQTIFTGIGLKSMHSHHQTFLSKSTSKKHVPTFVSLLTNSSSLQLITHRSSSRLPLMRWCNKLSNRFNNGISRLVWSRRRWRFKGTLMNGIDWIYWNLCKTMRLFWKIMRKSLGLEDYSNDPTTFI